MIPAPEVTAFYEARTGSVQYVVADPATRQCAIIDPVLDYDEKSAATATIQADLILNFVTDRGYRVAWILDTHPHADHFSAADYLKRRTGAGSHWSDEEILEFFPRLGERMETEADRLSGGEQQMAAVARALSGDTRVLLLDEPFEGLAPAVVEQLFHSFDKLREHLSIVIVDHNLDLALALSDRTVALEMGRVFHDGPSRALATDLDLRRQVLWL